MPKLGLGCTSHLLIIKWDVVTNPRKKDGGLNIKEARILNQAMLAKLGWKMMSDPETLWVRVFKNKYLKNSSFLDVAVKPNASYVWKSIASTRDIIREGSAWRIGDGANVQFWVDSWVPGGPLCDRVDNGTFFEQSDFSPRFSY